MKDHIVNRFESDSHTTHGNISLAPIRVASLPHSPSAAQRMRNVRLTSENASSRSAALGASLSAQTVRDMRKILDQISINDSRGVQCAVEGNRVRDSDVETKEMDWEGGRGRGRGWNAGRRENTRDFSEDRERDGAASASTSAVALRSSGSVFVHPTTLEPSGHAQGAGVGVGELEEEYSRKLLVVSQEMALLSASLETERRINNTLSAQLHTHTHRAADIGCEYFTEPAMDLDGEEVGQGEGPGQGQGEEDRRVHGQGQGQGLHNSRYTTHKTYSSFMQEAAQEIKEPDGEGTISHYPPSTSSPVSFTVILLHVTYVCRILITLQFQVCSSA